MRALRQGLVVLIAGICMAATMVAVATDQPSDEQFDAAQKQYSANLIDSLIADGSPRAMTLAATAVSYGGEHVQADLERQRSLLTRAAQLAPDDAWVQWIAAAYLQTTDTMSEPALALQRLEPENGAVWMFQLAAASQAKDEKGTTEALARIGAAHDFDNHFGDALIEWLKVIRAHPIPQAIKGSDQAAEQMPFILAISRAAAISMANFTSPTRACNSKKQTLAADRREACLAAGRLMLNESKTLVSMRIGAALLRLADAEDATEITRNADYFMKEASKLAGSAMFDPAELERYQADWLQTGSEIQAMKNQLSRAGIPLLPPNDWNEDPYGNLAKIARQKDG